MDPITACAICHPPPPSLPSRAVPRFARTPLLLYALTAISSWTAGGGAPLRPARGRGWRVARNSATTASAVADIRVHGDAVHLPPQGPGAFSLPFFVWSSEAHVGAVLAFVLGGIVLPPVAYVALKFSLTLSGSSRPLLETLEALAPVHIALATRPNGTGQEIHIPALTLVFTPSSGAKPIYSNVSDSLQTIVLTPTSVPDNATFDDTSLKANATDIENTGPVAFAAYMGHEAWAVASRKDVALVAFVVVFALIVAFVLRAWNQRLLALANEIDDSGGLQLEQAIETGGLHKDVKRLDGVVKRLEEDFQELVQRSLLSILKPLTADASATSTNILSFADEDKAFITKIAKEILEPFKDIAHHQKRQANLPPRLQPGAEQNPQYGASSAVVPQVASNHPPQHSEHRQNKAFKPPHTYHVPTTGEQSNAGRPYQRAAQAAGQTQRDCAAPVAHVANGSASRAQLPQITVSADGWMHTTPSPEQIQEQVGRKRPRHELPSLSSAEERSMTPTDVQEAEYLPSPVSTDEDLARKLQKGESHAIHDEAGNTQASAVTSGSDDDHEELQGPSASNASLSSSEFTQPEAAVILDTRPVLSQPQAAQEHASSNVLTSETPVPASPAAVAHDVPASATMEPAKSRPASPTPAPTAAPTAAPIAEPEPSVFSSGVAESMHAPENKAKRLAQQARGRQMCSAPRPSNGNDDGKVPANTTVPRPSPAIKESPVESALPDAANELASSPVIVTVTVPTPPPATMSPSERDTKIAELKDLRMTITGHKNDARHARKAAQEKRDGAKWAERRNDQGLAKECLEDAAEKDKTAAEHEAEVDALTAKVDALEAIFNPPVNVSGDGLDAVGTMLWFCGFRAGRRGGRRKESFCGAWAYDVERSVSPPLGPGYRQEGSRPLRRPLGLPVLPPFGRWSRMALEVSTIRHKSLRASRRRKPGSAAQAQTNGPELCSLLASEDHHVGSHSSRTRSNIHSTHGPKLKSVKGNGALPRFGSIGSH
ncbi:hypothetical protein EVG20_g5184 [Dentipellis fragilis]|uniref:Uncharacterized protein n=1 Tax=Dentipellis fragilis TaxID=205917 RepID=A0A4Y9YWD3_9AGAM|nr:hypothetical protein EVG20_g5184 [Dentipellis fragilis]